LFGSDRVGQAAPNKRQQREGLLRRELHELEPNGEFAPDDPAEVVLADALPHRDLPEPPRNSASPARAALRDLAWEAAGVEHFFIDPTVDLEISRRMQLVIDGDEDEDGHLVEIITRSSVRTRMQIVVDDDADDAGRLVELPLLVMERSQKVHKRTRATNRRSESRIVRCEALRSPARMPPSRSRSNRKAPARYTPQTDITVRAAPKAVRIRQWHEMHDKDG